MARARIQTCRGDGELIAAATIELPGGGSAPDWVHLMTAGRFTLRDGRGPFTLADAEAVVAETQRHVAAGEPPIDYDHQIDFAAIKGVGGRAPAAGWIKAFQVRDGQIWARVEWTEAARRAIEAREYRFLSPVFQHTKDGRVVRILRAALTNDPAMDLTAIASKENGMDEPLKELRAALGLPDDADKDRVVASIKAAAEAGASLSAIAKALGLTDEAKAGDIVEAAKRHRDTVVATAKVLNLGEAAKPEEVAEKVGETVEAAAKDGGPGTGREAGDKGQPGGEGEPDPGKYVPREMYDALARRVDAIESETVERGGETRVAAAVEAGKIAPAQRDWALSYAKADPKGFDAFVEKQPVICSGGELVPGARPPAGGDGDGLTAEDRAVCSALGLSPEAYLKTRKEEEKAT